MNRYLSILIISILIAGCQPEEFRYVDQLIGEWTIVKSERFVIFSDGSIDQFEDIDNAGTLEIFEASPPASLFKAFTMSSVNFDGDAINLASNLLTDEASKRITMSKVLCTSPFECDIVWTVDENSRNRQVWSAYGTDQFFYPPDRYDPSDDDFHLKWTITLER